MMDSLREELKQRLPWRRSATREVAETYRAGRGRVEPIPVEGRNIPVRSL